MYFISRFTSSLFYSVNFYDADVTLFIFTVPSEGCVVECNWTDDEVERIMKSVVEVMLERQHIKSSTDTADDSCNLLDLVWPAFLR